MISIQRAEELKREFTDKWVVVKDGVPELRRFSGLTGKVKTVNMNCRALVQFDNPVDISWYDIDLDYLTVVDQPLPKKEPEKEQKKEAPAKKAAPKKPAATGGMSPLEAARAQGAAGAAPKTTEKKTTEKKSAGLSPLELARQQGAAGKAPATPAPAAPSTEATGEKKLSPLELARQQGAAGAKPAEEPAAAAEEEPGAAAAEDKAEAESAPAAEEDTSGLSPLELARKQGAFKPKE